MASERTSLPLRLLTYLSGPLADLAAWAGIALIVPQLVARFAHGARGNEWWILGAYLLLCLGVWLARSLDNAALGASPAATPSCIAWLAWPYAIFVIVMIFMATGGGPGGQTLIDRIAAPDGWLALMLCAAFLLIALAFPVLLILPPAVRIRCSPPAQQLLKLLATCLVNAMALVTTAFWQWTLADAEPMGLALGGRIVVTLAVLPVFLMFYAPPRLALLSLEPNRLVLIPYLLMLASLVWGFVR